MYTGVWSVLTVVILYVHETQADCNACDLRYTSQQNIMCSDHADWAIQGKVTSKKLRDDSSRYKVRLDEVFQPKNIPVWVRKNLLTIYTASEYDPCLIDLVVGNTYILSGYMEAHDSGDRMYMVKCDSIYPHVTDALSEITGPDDFYGYNLRNGFVDNCACTVALYNNEFENAVDFQTDLNCVETYENIECTNQHQYCGMNNENKCQWFPIHLDSADISDICQNKGWGVRFGTGGK